MARGGEQVWSKEALVEAYQEHAGPDLTTRLIEVLHRVDGLGRLLTARTIKPAFGIAGITGRRVLSIWEGVTSSEGESPCSLAQRGTSNLATTRTSANS
jgi:hypothetical protein